MVKGGHYTPPRIPGGILGDSRDSRESTGNPGEHKASPGTPILLEVFPGSFLVDSWTVPSTFLGTPGMGQEYS